MLLHLSPLEVNVLEGLVLLTEEWNLLLIVISGEIILFYDQKCSLVETCIPIAANCFAFYAVP